MLRFPHLGQRIFEQLADQDMTKCLQVSRNLLMSLENQKFFLVRLLLNWSKTPNRSLKEVLTQFDVETLKEIAAAGNQIRNERSRSEQRPVSIPLIHCATLNGDIQIFEKIFHAVRNKSPKLFDRTPFHVAADKGNLEICQFIIKNTSDKNPRNRHGISPLHVVAKNGQLSICQLIIDNINPTKINEINFFDTNRNTPLHFAAKNGHSKICQIILSKAWWPLRCFNPNLQNSDGYTAFHYAADKGLLKVCEMMVLKCIDRNPKNPIHHTPLHSAAEKGHLEICRLITDNICTAVILTKEASHLCRFVPGTN